MDEKKYTFENREYRDTYRHSTSHVLAQAVKRLYPEAKLAIGPAIENGFYYDIDCDVTFTPEILEKIEEEARRAALPPIELEPQAEENVDFDTFCKSDFRVVKVKSCEAVKKSDRLLKFILDDGTGVDRQILSGIHKWYKPEDLVGKTRVAIVNLPPRKMMGLESNGMLISAVHKEKGEEVVSLLMLDDKIPAGAKLC